MRACCGACRSCRHLLVLGLVAALFGRVPTALIGGWSLLTLGIECGRAFYAERILRNLSHFKPAVEHRRMVALAFVAGLADGLAGVLFMSFLPLEGQAFLGVVMFATPAAGVAVSMSSRYIAGAFSIAVVVPSCVIWGVLHPSQLGIVLALGALYCGLLILVATEGERLLLRSVGIRHERDQVLRDLERRNADVREAVERAEQAAQARSRVLAAASQDLRQPLHALSIYSAVLAADPSPATLREVGSNIDQIVRSLGALLHGLLDLSRLAAAHYVPERQAFQLDALLAGICEEFQSAAAAKGLAFTSALEPMALCGDALGVARIARNLMDNAVKYTDAGAIHVALVRDGDEALLTVSDTGRGIPDADLARVFEEFYQVGNPSRDRAQGVGLGLAIVQRLAQLMGGAVSVRSRLGEGSSFSLRVPDASAAAVPSHVLPAALAEPSAAPARESARVYLVDDEHDILDSVALLLRHCGMQVHTAADSSEAGALFARMGPPDLLIADLRLIGGEHGAALADRMLREHGRFETLIVTGETSSEALREANAAGHPTLQKPVDAGMLRAALDAAIARAALYRDDPESARCFP